MALAKKCDICGRYYDPYEVEMDGKAVNGFAWTWADTSEGNEFLCPFGETIDCCPECMAKIRDFIAELRKKRSNKSSYYIVRHIDELGEINGIVGVYSTKEKAKQAIEDEIDSWTEDRRDDVRNDYYILKWEVEE